MSEQEQNESTELDPSYRAHLEAQTPREEDAATFEGNPSFELVTEDTETDEGNNQGSEEETGETAESDMPVVDTALTSPQPFCAQVSVDKEVTNMLISNVEGLVSAIQSAIEGFQMVAGDVGVPPPTRAMADEKAKDLQAKLDIVLATK